MWVITLTWVETGLPPQTTIRSDLAISRPSTPRLTPTPASQPASDKHVADRQILARIAHRMAQPVDPVALHQPHRAGVVIGPDRLASRGAGRRGSAPRRPRRGPRPKRSARRRRGRRPSRRPGAAAARAGRVMLALGIAGDLGADDARAYSSAPRPRAPARSAGRRTARPRARRRSGNHAGRRVGTMSSGKDRLRLDLTEYKDELAGSKGGETAPLATPNHDRQFHQNCSMPKSAADLQQSLSLWLYYRRGKDMDHRR